MKKRTIFCCTCASEVQARLTNGKEIYPHRTNLISVPFWVCDTCKNYVGCHYKSDYPIRPLGCIPSAALRAERQRIHALIDPAWKGGRITRTEIYRHISKKIGWEYHTADIRSVEEANLIFKIAQNYLKNYESTKRHR